MVIICIILPPFCSGRNELEASIYNWCSCRSDYQDYAHSTQDVVYAVNHCHTYYVKYLSIKRPAILSLWANCNIVIWQGCFLVWCNQLGNYWDWLIANLAIWRLAGTTTCFSCNRIKCCWCWIFRENEVNPMADDTDPSGYGLSQWETTLQCNVVSHWLSPYREWFLVGIWDSIMRACADVLTKQTSNRQTADWRQISQFFAK